MNKQTVLDALKGRDRRSIGRSCRMMAIVRRHPAQFPALMDDMHNAGEFVRICVADAIETLTATPDVGFNQPVSFSCGGLPVGAACNVTPATDTPTGTATITVTGSSASGNRTVPITLTVTRRRNQLGGGAGGIACLLDQEGRPPLVLKRGVAPCQPDC